MRLLTVLVAALVAALLVAGWLPIDRMPLDLRDVPLPMILFIVLGVIGLAVIVSAGNSRRL
jgi:hypothetical protein